MVPVSKKISFCENLFKLNPKLDCEGGIELSKLISAISVIIDQEKFENVEEFAKRVHEICLTGRFQEVGQKMERLLENLFGRQFQKTFKRALVETVTNAFDAQFRANNLRKPIKIYLKGDQFSVTDQGTGMGWEEIVKFLGIGKSANKDVLFVPSQESETFGRFGQGGLSPLYYLAEGWKDMRRLSAIRKTLDGVYRLGFLVLYREKLFAFSAIWKKEIDFTTSFEEIPLPKKEIRVTTSKGKTRIEMVFKEKKGKIFFQAFSQVETWGRPYTRLTITSPKIKEKAEKLIKNLGDTFRFFTQTAIYINDQLINPLSELSKIDFQGGVFYYSKESCYNKEIWICSKGELVTKLAIAEEDVFSLLVISLHSLPRTPDRESLDFQDPNTLSRLKNLIHTIFFDETLSLVEKAELLNALHPVFSNQHFNLIEYMQIIIRESTPQILVLPRLGSSLFKVPQAVYFHADYFSLYRPTCLPFFQKGSLEAYYMENVGTTPLNIFEFKGVTYVFVDQKLKHPKAAVNHFNLALIQHMAELDRKKIDFSTFSLLAPPNVKPDSSQLKKLDLSKYSELTLRLSKEEIHLYIDSISQDEKFKEDVKGIFFASLPYPQNITYYLIDLLIALKMVPNFSGGFANFFFYLLLYPFETSANAIYEMMNYLGSCSSEKQFTYSALVGESYRTPIYEDIQRFNAFFEKFWRLIDENRNYFKKPSYYYLSKVDYTKYDLDAVITLFKQLPDVLKEKAAHNIFCMTDLFYLKSLSIKQIIFIFEVLPFDRVTRGFHFNKDHYRDLLLLNSSGCLSPKILARIYDMMMGFVYQTNSSFSNEEKNLMSILIDLAKEKKELGNELVDRIRSLLTVMTAILMNLSNLNNNYYKNEKAQNEIAQRLNNTSNLSIQEFLISYLDSVYKKEEYPASAILGALPKENIIRHLSNYILFDQNNSWSNKKKLVVDICEYANKIPDDLRPFIYALMLGETNLCQSKTFEYPVLKSGSNLLHKDSDVVKFIGSEEVARQWIQKAILQNGDPEFCLMELFKNCFESGSTIVSIQVHLVDQGKEKVLILSVKDNGSGISEKHFISLKIAYFSEKEFKNEDRNQGVGFYSTFRVFSSVHVNTSEDGINFIEAQFQKDLTTGELSLQENRLKGQGEKGTEVILKKEITGNPFTELVKIRSAIFSICSNFKNGEIRFNGDLVNNPDKPLSYPLVSHTETFYEKGEKSEIRFEMHKQGGGIYRKEMKSGQIEPFHIHFLPPLLKSFVQDAGLCIYLPANLPQVMNRSHFIHNRSLSVVMKQGILALACRYIQKLILSGEAWNKLSRDFWDNFSTGKDIYSNAFTESENLFKNYLENGIWPEKNSKIEQFIKKTAALFKTFSQTDAPTALDWSDKTIFEYLDMIEKEEKILEKEILLQNLLKKWQQDPQSLLAFILHLKSGEEGLSLLKVRILIQEKLSQAGLLNQKGFDFKALNDKTSEKISEIILLVANMVKNKNYWPLLKYFEAAIQGKVRAILQQSTQQPDKLKDQQLHIVGDYLKILANDYFNKMITTELYTDADNSVARVVNAAPTLYINRIGRSPAPFLDFCKKMETESYIYIPSVAEFKPLLAWLETVSHETRHMDENENCETHDEQFMAEVIKKMQSFLIQSDSQESSLFANLPVDNQSSKRQKK